MRKHLIIHNSAPTDHLIKSRPSNHLTFRFVGSILNIVKATPKGSGSLHTSNSLNDMFGWKSTSIFPLFSPMFIFSISATKGDTVEMLLETRHLLITRLLVTNATLLRMGVQITLPYGFLTKPSNYYGW